MDSLNVYELAVERKEELIVELLEKVGAHDNEFINRGIACNTLR